MDEDTAAYHSIDGRGYIKQDGKVLIEADEISQGDTIRCIIEFVKEGIHSPWFYTLYSFIKNEELICDKRYINSSEIFPTIYVSEVALGDVVEVEFKFHELENNTTIGILYFIFMHV